ncbi:hypothetical protein [Geminisphaera colitermitum]|uniref:hypothetical protein n=1 Tax=Geminisphaera colitermitum TaxID=1148786 RepID=UPI0001964ED1|nr:hypothetical protein [Geminisphaera colitermitum]
MSEYGWTIEYTLTRPLSQTFAFYAAISARYGNEAKGPTYQERAQIHAAFS